MKLKQFDFLIIGQLKTSRTETLEEYLKPRTHSLGVIGIMSPFASYNESRCTLYEKGLKFKEFQLPSFCIKEVNWWKQPLMCISFMVYFFSVFISVFRLHRKFDIFIGIATFSTMLGLILKKLGIVKKVIYYCLDYYPPPKGISFNNSINTIYKNVDKWVVRKVDIVWHISPRIREARERYAKVPANSYKEVIVPLGYSNNIYRDCPLEKRERWTLGFIGTLSENQGLQMVAEAIPRLAVIFPEIKVRILGHGPYVLKLKDIVKKLDVEDRFIFHGFVHDENEVYDILSRCMIGLATWTGDETDNSLYADPGKPKLYALLGLPIIITSAPFVSQLIAETEAGEVISYSVDDFINAVRKIIASKEKYTSYKNGLEKFKIYCLAENIFNQAFSKLFSIFDDFI